MEISVEPSKTYAVTTSGSCTVTDADGLELCTASSGSQAFFVATTPTVTISDDGAKVSRATFNYALAVAGLLGGGDKLPAGYTRVDFLQSTGAQWIDTGIVPTAAHGLKIDHELLKDEDTIPLGCRNTGSSDTRFYALRAPRMSTVGTYLGYGWGAWTALNPNAEGKRVNSELNWLNSGVAAWQGATRPLSALPFTPTYSLFMFAANIGGTAALLSSCRVWQASISLNNSVMASFVSALDPTGTPCMFDTVSKEPFKNAGSGQFVAGVGSVAQLTALLRNLPSTGGTLTLSLPAEANTPEVADMLQACHDSKGWTLTVHEYRPAEASTYSLRRVRDVVWCRRELSEYGSYVDADGFRWRIDRCVAIFGALGQDPDSYCYTPFDRVEQAVEFWEMQPYVDPNAEELTTEA